MRRFFALVLGLAFGAGLVGAVADVARAGYPDYPDEGVVMGVRRADRFPAKGGFTTAADETVWVGYLASSTDPNKVGAGGVWDFDAGAAGSDSAQFWQFWRQIAASDAGNFPTPPQRPQWYYNYGNQANRGDHNLWKSRALAGRTFRRTGLAGIWHSDDMTGVSAPITGARSAWCGLRVSGDVNATQIDELTGNSFTSDQHMPDFRGGAAVRSTFPGYGNMWDQILYRDFPYAGAAIAVTFNMVAELDSAGAADAGGSAWHNPNDLSPSNLITTGPNGPADSMMVWVGAPREGVYDTNRRALSDVVNFGIAAQPQKIYSVSGIRTEAVSVNIPAGGGWGATVRLAFQVKTNRLRSDFTNGGGVFNSTAGAVMIDDVNVGGNISTFDAAASIRPRVLLASNGAETPVDPATTWITTGRPPSAYFHPANTATELAFQYADPCGDLAGNGNRLCNLNGVVLTAQYPPDSRHVGESQNWATSPTVVLVGSRATAQGTAPPLRTDASKINIEFDYYTGNDDPTVTGLFFWYAVRYYGPTIVQAGAPTVPAWSPANTPGVISAFGFPLCQVNETDGDLLGFVPISTSDSLQMAIENQLRCARFFATDCGGAFGGWWDQMRMGFVKAGPAAPAMQTFFWFLLGDAFPVNQGNDPAPGTANFDTTTAQVKDALNQGPDSQANTEGVVNADSIVYTSPYGGGGVRLDLVFRILPGPGNYSVKGDPTSALLKVPSAPGLGTATAGDASFWGSYMANRGLVGAGSHGATRWNPDTWNSARMDSGQVNLSPVTARNTGVPPITNDQWAGTYHEAEYAPGGPREAYINALPAKNLCFLVDQSSGAPADHTNICCDPTECSDDFGESYPPAGYPGGTPTTSKEGWKIIPDGLLTPGSHVQYFVRRSLEGAEGTAQVLSPDTSVVSSQPNMGGYLDQLRFDHFDILPDLWKDPRFNAAIDAAYPNMNKGNGLPCLLVVDGRDRIGLENALGGTLDSAGYGQDNGAVRGWKRSLANLDNVNDPAGFVSENLGQKGLAYDWWDQRAGESTEGHRLGCRLASSVPVATQGKQCTAGPTLEMLEVYYSTIIWASDDLDESAGALHDGVQNAQQANDVRILREWLDNAASGDARALWVNGDGAAQYLAQSPSVDANDFLANYLGATVVADNYFATSGNVLAGSVWKPLDTDPGAGDPFSSARRYGMFNSCLNEYDVLGTASVDYALASRYEQFSDRSVSGVGAGPFGASVYRNDIGGARNYATLVDGFSFRRLRGWNGASDPTTSLYSLTFNNHAQRAWLESVMAAFNTCSRSAPVVAVGEQPGVSAVNFVRGAFPNPAPAGQATVNFTLAQPSKVTIRFYSVAGRLVHEAEVEGAPGANQYKWNGVTSTGQQATSGVYFYRLFAPGVEFQNNAQRMVLLGQAGN